MSWVVIDQEKCNQCGICMMRCGPCFSRKEDRIVAHADEDCCNLCGHCVALCPTQAITHSSMDMSNFLDLEKKVAFDTDDFIQFVRQRRSHRFFREKAVPREELEKLIDLCRYAPTGSNRQTTEITVIQDRDRRKRLSDLTVDFYREMIEKVETEYACLKSQGKEIPSDFQEQYDTLVSRKRLIKARDLGIDPIFHSAPAVMLFHSRRQPSTPKDDCVIAAHTVVLAAMTMGLETCYIGLFEKAVPAYTPLKKELNLPPGNVLHSVLVLGYPRLTFLRTVDRRPINIRWE
jgi:nitroreductase/NAD-dependent dihydropyrimidine dehydrogenase PreA subunit